MKSDVSLLTTAAKTATDKTVADYGAGIFAHLAGDWQQHSQARIHPVPYQVATSAVSAPTLAVSIYANYVDTGSDITFSGPVGSFGSASISFGTLYSWNWHAYGLSKFAADIVGQVTAATTGNYTFTLRSDDGSYLFIDGALLISNGGKHAALSKSGTVHLTQGDHTLRVKFYEDFGGDSGLDLYLPSGIVYRAQPVTQKTVSSHKLRMLLDYGNNGTPATGAFEMPANFTNNVFSNTAAPIIITQPADTAVAKGSSAVLSVVAISNLTLSYQWLFNGSPIPGAVASSYILYNVQAVNTGDYSVNVTNATGTTASRLAALSLT